MSEEPIGEKSKRKILEDPTLTEAQKQSLLKQVDKTLKIKVETDTKALETITKLAEENALLRGSEKTKEELEEENEDFKAKLELLAEKELEARMSKLGIPEHERNYFRENPEGLKAYEMAKKSSIPSPSFPLDSQQLEAQKGFNSYEEMVEALRKAEREGNKEAKRILNTLMQKAMLGVKQSEKGHGLIEPNEQPSIHKYTYRKRKKRSEDD